MTHSYGALAAAVFEDDPAHDGVEAPSQADHDQSHDDRDGPGGDGRAL